MGFLSKLLGVDLEGESAPAPLTSRAVSMTWPPDADFRAKVEIVLEQVRPGIRADGGDVELVDIVGHSVRLKLVGACESCSSSTMTLRHGIETKLRAAIPEFESLIPF